MKLRILIVLIVPLLAAAQNDPLAGRAGAAMRMGFGSEGMAMGNAMAGTRSRVNAGYYNPALAAWQAAPEVFAGVGFLSLDRHLNVVNFSTPLPPQAGLSLGLINAGVSQIDERDSDGRSTGSFATSENMFLLSFGLHASDRLSLGISAKIHYHRLYPGISSTTAGFDVGFLYAVSEELAIGGVLQDLGSKYRWDTTPVHATQGNTTTDFFPIRRRLGVSYAPGGLPLLASWETELVGEVLFVKAGAAYAFTEFFTLRAGVDRVGISHSISSRPSAGFSIVPSTGTWRTHLSYALILEPSSPSPMHLVTVGLEFH